MRERIIEALADYYHIHLEYTDDGEIDTSNYDFTSGCSFNGEWLCLQNIIKIIEKTI